MTATVKILRGNLGALNQSTGQVGGLVNPTTIYSGKARIWNVEGAGVFETGDGPIDTRQTFVSIPYSARPVPKRDDLVEIIYDDPADSDLDTRYFRVLEVDGGALIAATRKLTCTSFYPSRYWGQE